MYDWNKILCLKYLGEDEADELAFQAYLKQRGVREMDAVLTGFYPELKQKIMGSWPRLFRHHEQIRAGEKSGAKSVQAPCGRLKKNGLCRKRSTLRIRKPGQPEEIRNKDKKKGRVSGIRFRPCPFSVFQRYADHPRAITRTVLIPLPRQLPAPLKIKTRQKNSIMVVLCYYKLSRMLKCIKKINIIPIETAK